MQLQLPEKMRPLFLPKRYKIMWGGRGGGKSHSVAAALLVSAASRRMRILCAREIQKSMRDSVHRLLKDKIEELGLGSFYLVLDNEIRGLNGSLFVFAGLQSHTVDSIKSFEGVDIVWVEEAHSVSKKSWDVLIPTIRKDGSEIWMTLNPDMDTDETYQRFILTTRPDAWVCEINWRDNPWFSKELENERLADKQTKSAEDYEHIWEGRPRSVSDGAIYANEMLAAVREKRICPVPYDPDMPVHTVWDLGWNDSMAIGMVQKGQFDVRVIGYIENSRQTLDFYVRELDALPYRWGTDYLPHDGRTRNFQTGKSTADILHEMGRRDVVVQSAQNVEEGIRAARMMFGKCYFDEAKTARLVECLKRYRRDTNSRTGAETKPLHDEFSHGADMFRYIAQALPLMGNVSEYRYSEHCESDWRVL